MKVQSALDLNKFELQNAKIQHQAGPSAVGWKVGLIQVDTQNGNRLMLGISDDAPGGGGPLERTNYLYLLDSRLNGISNDMLSGFTNQHIDIESALATHFPSCAAVKGFVNGIVASAMIYKGTLTPAQTSGQEITASMFIEGGVARTTLPTTKGWVYKCTASGYFGSIRMDAGDTIICNGGMDGTTADYDIVQGNIDLLNIPALRVVKDGKSIRIEDNSILLLNGSDNGPSLYLVDNGSNGYLRLSCEGDDYDNLKTSGWIDAGALKENGEALSAKYLGISAKAADADKFDGYDSAAFLRLATGGTITNNLQVGQSGSGNGKYLDVFGSLFADRLYLGHHNSPGTPYFLYEGDYGVKCDNPIEASAFYENGTPLSDKYAPKASTPKMFRANITGNGSTTTFTLTHNLGTQSPIVQVYEQTSREQVLVDVVANAANTVQVKFGAAPANGKVYNVVIMG